MITVKIFKNKNNIYEVDVEGHAGYEELGKDIVCAAVSGIVQTAVLGLIRVLNLQLHLIIEEGFMRFCIPNGLNEDLRLKVNIILDTMVIGLKEIEKSYSDYIEVRNIEGGV